MLWLPTAMMLGVVPTPAQVLMADAEVQPRAVLTLAQAPDADEEKALEEDMDKAHRRVVGEPPPAHDQAGHEHADHHHGEYREAFERYDRAQSEPSCDCDCECSKRPQRGPGGKPTLDGHGKAHYLVWGIVDWVITGALWGGGLFSAVISANALYLGTRTNSEWQDMFHESPEPGARRGLRAGGVAFAGIAAGLGIGGTLLSAKARANVRTYRELRAQALVFSGAR